ncbi:DNA/RNA non-specific endonuclease [Lactococcus lactis]|uniref:DNA/RNA non-specific endonuclease n=1 Tax=Lactococcus lactis TaxID=1358 RepID=UPI0022E355CF|nr:DNA/RNA non-specific endonuclease [Lactococcus lactis]
MKNKKIIPLLIVSIFILGGCANSQSDMDKSNHKWSQKDKTPSEELAKSVLTSSIKEQLKTDNIKFDHGSFIVNNNNNDLAIINVVDPYAKNEIDIQGRPYLGEAVLPKSIQNNEKDNKDEKVIPQFGWGQKSNLKGFYKKAYTKGFLLNSKLIGGVKDFNDSGSNMENIFTQTVWASEANDSSSKGQKYFENMIHKVQDKNMIIKYRVKALYDGSNLVPSGTEIEAKSDDFSLEIHVFIPNVQTNLKVDYKTGQVTEVK